MGGGGAGTEQLDPARSSSIRREEGRGGAGGRWGEGRGAAEEKRREGVATEESSPSWRRREATG
jgi:hypothetical protein